MKIKLALFLTSLERQLQIINYAISVRGNNTLEGEVK